MFAFESDGSGTINWWVDSSDAVHPNMHGHTGATMSMGHASVYTGIPLNKNLLQEVQLKLN